MELTNFLSSLDTPVRMASIGIALLAAIAWLTWAPRIRKTALQLSELRRHFEKREEQGREAISEAVQKTRDINIRALLAEVQSGLFVLPGDFGNKTYSLRSYQDIWTPKAL